jgi:hypothetical protein
VRLLPALLAASLAALVATAPADGAVSNDRGHPIIVVAGDVTVLPNQVVEEIIVINGHVRVLGRVENDVVVVDGDVFVRGEVEGSLVTVAGPAHLLPGAMVGGDLRYGDDAPVIAPSARVGGDVEKESWSDTIGLYSILGAFVLWLAVGISAAVLGLLLLMLAPRAADAIFAQAQARFWTAVGIGAAIFIAVPIAILVAAITLVGLPLSIAIGLAVLPFAAIAYVTAAWTLGRVMVRPPGRRFLAFLAGLAVLRLAALIPAVGLLVDLGAVIVGLGLLGAAIAASRDPAPAHAPGS